MTEINLKSMVIKDYGLMFSKKYLKLFNSPKDNKEKARIKFTPTIQYKLVEAPEHKGKKK